MSVKLRVLFFVLLVAPAVYAQAPFTIVSGASYQSTIAPDSLASIFGTNLAQATASATLDANGQLPTELAATRVEVDGKAAALIYVSPSQINFVVPGDLASGTINVIIRSTNGGATRGSTVAVAQAAPGIFSSDASGRGPGAILNAINFRPAPFLTVTGDTRTRLAVYSTGVRHAKKVTAQAVDIQGNRFDLVVEFSGAAPGFFGLDQVNVVLPPDLDGAGVVSLTLTADDTVSNTVTFEMASLSPGALQLAGVTLTPSTVIGGQTMTATVFLNGLARFGGFPVTLRSTNLAAVVPALVTIPEGKASAQVTVTTTSVITPQTGSLIAQAQGVSFTADFVIDVANQTQLSSVTVAPSSVLGGRNLSGAIVLTAPAPAPGLSVAIASDSDTVRPPATVTVPAGQTGATFTIPTSPVTSVVNAKITATLRAVTASASVQLLPPMSLSLDLAATVGGGMVNGTVLLGEPAPVGGALILLSTSNATLAQVPVSVLIPAGQSTGTFTVTTLTVTVSGTVIITANYLGITQTANLTVTTLPAPVLSGLTTSPTQIIGGTTAQGLITLAAPAGPGGERVNLQTSLFLVAQVPGFVSVPQGFTTANFTIQTNPVINTQAVVITAILGGVSKSTVLTITAR
jgi:uncharacterized protein (TIGR03437 family)